MYEALRTPMIFGQPSDFAIEAYHEPYGPKWGGFGRMCIHIQGKVIGNIRNNHCSLFNATENCNDLHDNIETMWDPSFAGLHDIDIYNFLDRLLYQNHGQSFEQITADSERYRRFIFLTNTGEQFDGSSTFIICRPGGIVTVLYQIGEESPGSGSCRVESFRTVVEVYVQWFYEQVKTITPPYFPINPFDVNEHVPDDWKH